MPNPSDFNNESDFMKECISKMVGEGKEQDQAVAACSSMWSKKLATPPPVDPNAKPAAPPTGAPAEVKPPKGKIEILAEIKKLLEKNGFTVGDDKLLSFFQTLTPEKTDTVINKFSLKIIENNGTYEIKIFPRKEVYIDKYKKRLNFDSNFFLQVINNFQNAGLFKPYMDLEHKLGEKYAEIIALEEKDDGLYAKINLNASGMELVKNNKYSYISPEWGDRVDTNGLKHSNVLWSVTLTNVPALEGELPSLQEQIKLSKGEKMNLKENLLKLEGRLTSYRLAGEPAAAAIPPELLDAIAMLKEAIAKIDELTGQKEVAEEAATEAQAAMNVMQKEKLEKERDQFFKECLQNGQIEANEIDDWKLQYNISKDFVVKMLSSKPIKNGNNKSLSATKQKTSNDLDNEDYWIMSNRGMNPDDPKDVRRYKNEVLGVK